MWICYVYVVMERELEGWFLNCYYDEFYRGDLEQNFGGEMSRFYFILEFSVSLVCYEMI